MTEATIQLKPGILDDPAPESERVHVKEVHTGILECKDDSRVRLVAAALQGLCSRPCGLSDFPTYEDAANAAVRTADGALKKMEQTKP